jgi:hypothetical protein
MCVRVVTISRLQRSICASNSARRFWSEPIVVFAVNELEASRSRNVTRGGLTIVSRIHRPTPDARRRRVLITSRAVLTLGRVSHRSNFTTVKSGRGPVFQVCAMARMCRRP